ncbi:MAG: PD40 domain-containing protein, partial [Myxococcales bacterium]|nr:PD40 domain-containing protein [Myxococcales bacterium]
MTKSRSPRRPLLALVAALAFIPLVGCTRAGGRQGLATIVAGESVPDDAGEPRLTNLRRLTDGGENAEAYWSADGTRLVYQSTPTPGGCDQIYTLDLRSKDAPRRVSTGAGRTTCAYFHDQDRRILFASTHAASPECPPPPDRSAGYVWALYDTYDIYSVKADGSDLRPLITGPGYDAEATVCPADGRIVFTSTRDGDIDLYVADADGANVRRLTDAPGYDGGAFFSPDCSKIVWRASRPEGKDLEDYRALLARGLVRPSHMELWVMDGDGANRRQITFNGAANFAPYFFPSGDRIVFASNLGDRKGRNFDLYAVDLTGANLERVTVDRQFEAFPMFSPDGRRLAFAANRFGKKHGETNVFVARWRPDAFVPPSHRIATPADRYLEDVRFLADPAREGRGLGTKGIEEAAFYLEDRMREAGLRPAFGTEYAQRFPVTVGVTLGPRNALADSEGALALEKDFMPASFSSTGAVDAEVVFAGYGISAHEQGWDDYRGVDVRGKAALVLRYHPKEDAPEGPLSTEEARRYSDLRYKAFNAREHGARALLLVAGPLGHEDDPDTLAKPAPDGPESEAGIPVLFVTRATADRWLRRQGTSLAGEQSRVDAGEANPHLLPLGRVNGRVDLEKKTTETRNVVGILPGLGDGTEGAVVVGAHYDHLGFGGPSSLAPGVHALHPGADDNAS